MWDPSTSASVIIITLWYLSFSSCQSSPLTPQPRAVIRLTISSEDKTLSILAFSTFIIFPLRGSIAWKCLSLPCFAEPPADSPSTRKISLLAGSFSWKSDSFPGRPHPSKTPFLLVSSLAFLAASLAFAASSIFVAIILASEGFSKRNSVKDLYTLL